MPPMFINVGAYVDEGSMIDSHALVGSCAQVGKRVHLSAAAQVGGVLEPINATMMIEDDVLIGGFRASQHFSPLFAAASSPDRFAIGRADPQNSARSNGATPPPVGHTRVA